MSNVEVEQFITSFSKSIALGKASIFIGSGLSREANYAGWSDILKDCAAEIGLNVNSEKDLITLAEYYINSRQRTKINDTIKEFFNDEKGLPQDTHKIIASLPISSIWTTNYDSLIERALSSSEKSFTVLTDDKSYINIDSRAMVTIHKIHGTYSSPDKCIITRTDYERFSQNHDIVLSELKSEMCSKSFLFLGYSFSDTDIQHIFTNIRLIYSKNNYPQRHYCIMRKVIIEECENDQDYNYSLKKQEHFINDMQKYGVNVVLIENFNQIKEILESIRKRVLSKNVLISGSYEENDDYIRNLALELSSTLIKKDFNIYTGFGKNLGNDIVEGAFEGCSKYGTRDVKKFNDSVYIFPFPYKKNKSESRDNLYMRLRNNMVSNTTIHIIIAGIKKEKKKIIDSPGIFEEAMMSLQKENIIISIGYTGGAAKKIWENISRLNLRYSNDEDYKGLNSKKDVKEMALLVMKLIDKYSF